jgi:hypothetical protein
MTSWLGCRTLRCTGPALALLAPAAGDRGGGHALLEGGDARGARGDATGRRVVANRAATRGDLVGGAPGAGARAVRAGRAREATQQYQFAIDLTRKPGVPGVGSSRPADTSFEIGRCLQSRRWAASFNGRLN